MKVKVRIAVAVDQKGKWGCCGWHSDKKKEQEEMMALAVESLDDGEARYWLTAELDCPDTPKDIAANVESAT